MPDILQHYRPVPAQHKAHMLIGVAAPYQSRRQFVHPSRSAEPHNLVFTVHVIARISFCERVLQDYRRAQVIRA